MSTKLTVSFSIPVIVLSVVMTIEQIEKNYQCRE